MLRILINAISYVNIFWYLFWLRSVLFSPENL